MRALVIDDENQVRNAISLVLRSSGFEVVAAENGRAGLRAFQTSAFDLAIIDIFMPEMDGVKLIKALRADNPHFPVIAVSGVHLPPSGGSALDFFPLAPELAEIVRLHKPFKPADLKQAIAKALAASASEAPAA